MSTSFDLIIVGGGPAGSAAAITAVERGLSVLLLERFRAPQDRPGETLHPGAEPLFEQLGVAGAMRTASLHRHDGCHLQTAAGSSYQSFGEDSDGPWRGFQIRRDLLDKVLVQRAQQRGTVVSLGSSVQAVQQDRGGRVAGVTADGVGYEGRWVLDASGCTGWLRRQLQISIERYSPRLFAWYGYVAGPPPSCDGNPRLVVESGGWTWIAPLEPDNCAWVQLSIDPGLLRPQQRPAALRDCAARGPVRGMDVSWRLMEQVAGRGFLVAGDAACVIDPAASHGILKALMSGIMAAHCIAQVESGAVSESAAIAHYQSWLRQAFEGDAQTLLGHYRELGIATAGWSSSRLQLLQRL